MHPRRAIMEDLRSQLSQATGLPCKIQRMPPINRFPSITIFSESEVSENVGINISPVLQERSLDVVIQGWHRGGVDEERSEEALDDLAERIEKCVQLPECTESIELTGTNFDLSEDEPKDHRVILSYRIKYTTLEFLS